MEVDGMWSDIDVLKDDNILILIIGLKKKYE